MASESEQVVEDSSLSKAVWHYLGIGVLWLSLFVTGVAFERLGLTTSFLTGLLPGDSMRVYPSPSASIPRIRGCPWFR